MNAARQDTQRTRAVLLALCAVAFVGAAWATADIPPLRPDTASYLYFDPSRAIGYPIFLWVFRESVGLRLAVPIQMLILTISLFLLGWAFYNWTRRPILSALFQMALIASPEMWRFAATLITEAPGTAAVALWCAQLLRTFRSPSLRGVGLLTVISGVAMIVKPALLPLFLGTSIAAFAVGSRGRWAALGTTFAGLLASLAVTPIGNYLVHGSPAAGSPVARGVLQHTLFCAPSHPPVDRDAAFVEQSAKGIRAYVNKAPAYVQPMLKRLYTGELRFGLIIPTLGRRHGLEAGWQTDPLIWRITKERLAANPRCYAASVLSSYFSMATYKTYSRAETKRAENFLLTRPLIEVPRAPLLPSEEQLAAQAAQEIGAAEPSLPGRQDFDLPTGRPLILVWIARLIYGSAAGLGLLAIFLLPAASKMSPELRKITACAAALGAVFHGVMGLTAAVELPLARYTVSVWPVVCTLLGIIGVFALEQARHWQLRTENRRDSSPVGSPMFSTAHSAPDPGECGNLGKIVSRP